MTAPNPFIDSRGWPVVDRLLAAAFTELVTIPGRTVVWGTVLGADVVYPAGRVQRLPGGGINAEGYQDLVRVEVVSYGTDRPESDELTAGVRAVMAELNCGEYGGVGLDRVREDSGPGRIPDPNADLRAVPTVWSVTVRQQ